jgi:hypothetical protein
MNGTNSELLKEVTLQIYDQDVCQGIYDEVNVAINPGQLCADIPGGGSGSCNVRIF